MKAGAIEQLLPWVFQATLRPEGPLRALLEVMEVLHAPAEARLDRIEGLYNPYRTPERFVPYLAGWVDLERFFPAYGELPEALQRDSDPLSTGNGRLRELIAAAARLSQWRGTAEGLQLFLETATGVAGFQLNEQVPGADGRPRPFHIQVIAPAQTVRHRALIERIVEQEKPAYVTYELMFQPENGEGEEA